MKSFKPLWLATAILLQPAGAIAQDVARVSTLSGNLQGVSTTDVVAFEGIPYAAPPVGANRWRPPRPAVRWPGVRLADRYGADCEQAPFPQDAAPIRTQPAEDCLYLNVWKPRMAVAGQKRPVMVWIHGGGFVNGGSSPAIYSGERFARDGVVFVSFNYRLGRFGFFAHPALKAEGGGGNFGFMDQIAALRWVRANIAAFGGDPQNVTLVGESAGGMSVNVAMTAPGARGLFAKAIIESGAGRDGALPMRSLAVAALAGQAFLPGQTAASLRALPADRIVAMLSLPTMMTPTFSGPMIDGKTVWQTPFTAYSAGDYARVPLIIGANSADGIPFETDKAAIYASYGDFADKARALYDPTGTLPGIELGIATWADRNMIEPARAIAGITRRTQPVYLYRFGYVTPTLRPSMSGAPHASEIPYAFDTVNLRQQPPFAPADAPIAAAMHRYWVSFAATGRPAGKVAWPLYDVHRGQVQMIDANKVGQTVDPLASRLNFNEMLSNAPVTSAVLPLLDSK